MEAVKEVASLARAVNDKYQSVKALKPECRRAREVADSLLGICNEIEQDLARRPDSAPPLGKPLRYLRDALSEAVRRRFIRL